MNQFNCTAASTATTTVTPKSNEAAKVNKFVKENK